ncbi:hypothetical protein Dda_2301 [Drechslerella dactyloides]|uniref:AAA+ ATPase domain-containing protein n=1 Tax=Drechslerella dactyloides TaxID=74499 RepID=A0AAD6J7A8_DREDA|nr:hypothetical protein Dda_2301 [Drechslerella dactyloides]
MHDSLPGRLAAPDTLPETTTTEVEHVENTSADNFVSPATTNTVDDVDVNTNGRSASVNGEPEGVPNAVLDPIVEDVGESDVDGTTGKEGLKLSTASQEPSKNEDTESIVTMQEQTPASQQLRDELNELREQLVKFAKQAQEDRKERQKLENELQEAPLYVVPASKPAPPWGSAEWRRRRRRRNLGIDSSSEDDDEVGSEYFQAKQARHKSRMAKLFRRELKYLEHDGKMIQQFESQIAELQEKEQSWSVEREALELSIAEEKARARQRRSRSPAGRDGDTAEGESATEAPEDGTQVEDVSPTPPKHAIPLLSRVQWDIFKSIQLQRSRNEHECNAIEVLVGEPDISFESVTSWWFKRDSRHGKKGNMIERRGATYTAAARKIAGGTQIPGQAPVAERIRINSTHIIKVLEKIHGESLASDDGPVVMIRPYRALVYYSDQIQQTFQELEAEFAIKPETADIVNGIARRTTDMTDDTGQLGAEETTKAIQSSDAGEPVADNEEQEKQKPDEYTMSALAYQQMQVLMDFLNTEIRDKLAYLASEHCQKITFTDVWYLFKPGDEVIDRARRQAFRVIRVTSPPHKAIPPWRTFNTHTEPEETTVTVTCVYIDFDGKQLGPVIRDVVIKRFDGEKLVTSLDVYPLRFIKEDVRGNSGKKHRKTLRERLIERGRIFLDVAKVKHMHYNGHTIDERDEVDSQVVIDFDEAFSKNDWKVVFDSIIESRQEEKSEKELCTEACCRNDHIHKDSYAESRRNDEYIGGLIPQDKFTEPSVSIFPRNLTETRTPEKAIPDEDLMIMSYRVFGYVLRSRKWAKLDVQFLSEVGAKTKRLDGDDEDDYDEDGDGGGRRPDEQNKVAADVERIEEDETAFDQLVLPDGHRKMVISLVSQHFRDKESATAQTEQADVVRGKGKGLIILLHGAPGVGKTTTAEGIAELFKKPLFQITCGDLGATASDVEKALETHFTLASRWGCILLLDEADVFLAARTPQDFIRNGLVAVFLRVLEYYSGILFLTTNRIGTFDEAFASRIHISLHYPQLDLESTLAVFRLNIKLIRKRFAKKKREIDIKEQEILDYAKVYFEKNEKTRWNGRQIRNACQTALALAEFDAQGGDHKKIIDKHAKVELTLDQLRVVGKAYLEFIQYLDDVYDHDAESRAKALRIRAREGKKRKVSEGRLLGRRGPRKGKEKEKGWESVDETAEDDKGEVKKEPKSPSPLPPISKATSPQQQYRQQDAPVENSQGPAYGMPPGGYMNPNPMYYPGYGQMPPPGSFGQAPRVEGQSPPYPGPGPGWGGWGYPPAPGYGPMPGAPALEPSKGR